MPRRFVEAVRNLWQDDGSCQAKRKFSQQPIDVAEHEIRWVSRAVPGQERPRPYEHRSTNALRLRSSSRGFPWPRISALHNGCRPTRAEGWKRATEQEKHATRLIMNIGGMDLDLFTGPFGVDKHFSLASQDPLAAIIAAWTARLRRLHGLTINHGGGWLWSAAASPSVLLPQRLVYSVPFAIPAPSVEVVVAHPPGRQIMRHQLPGNTPAENIKAPINDPAKIMTALPPPSLALRKEGADEPPLFVCQIRRV